VASVHLLAVGNGFVAAAHAAFEVRVFQEGNQGAHSIVTGGGGEFHVALPVYSPSLRGDFNVDDDVVEETVAEVLFEAARFADGLEDVGEELGEAVGAVLGRHCKAR